MNKCDLKIGTEALIRAAQEQALHSKYVKYNIDHTGDSPLCRLCGAVSPCTILAQKEYKWWHNVALIVPWELCGKFGLKRSEKWYEHKPKAVLGNTKVKLLWDFSIHCDENIIERRPDPILVDKERKHCLLIDIAEPGDVKVAEKEDEKEDKYQPLKFEIMQIWEINKVEVIPIVVGAIGVATKKIQKWFSKIVVEIQTELLQKTALLGTARILRVLQM